MATDIRINTTTNEPVIINGDFDVEEGVVTDARLILGSNPNDFKHDPTIGLGLTFELNGDELPADLIKLDKDIRAQLAADGITVTKVNLNVNPFIVEVDG